ncbi:hypothetical protein [Deinococcus actinosclerus]|uniref:Uncharacterized protein n=1 Tax=Deinococcus actinosclerus TaxID=1768108 RepID=A0ABN4K3L6_9DEIO|nr:hypothetical protein [Deinococcus actinosclerus]ALW87727.1 hypothetical protein AUC44_01460 [Deinococcus actinosclerus]
MRRFLPLLAPALLALSGAAPATAATGWTYARLYVLTEYPVSPRERETQPTRALLRWMTPTLTRTFEERRPLTPDLKGLNAFLTGVVGAPVQGSWDLLLTFDALGRAGWELVDCVPFENVSGGAYHVSSECFFKRPR